MNTKLKEFKGSLNPVFLDATTNSEKITGEGSDYQENLLISKIKPRNDQPRKNFDENALEELAGSIRMHGVIQPIIVRPTQDGFFELIAGERRWRASKLAGLTVIPALIKNYDEVNRVAISLIENIQRENLNPIEEAEAINRLIMEFSMTHLEISKSIGKSRTTVTNMLRLLNLEEGVRLMLRDGFIEVGHAKALLALPESLQMKTAVMVMQQKLSVRETERLVDSIKNPVEKERCILDPLFAQKVEQWKIYFSKEASLKVGVHFDSTGKGGRVIINFDALDKMNWLIENLKFTEIQK